MALTPYKTYAAGEILTAADLNASFSYLTSNALQMISPLTGTLDADGNAIILDSDADSSVRASSDDVVTLKLQNVDLFVWNGATASAVNGVTQTAAATGSAPVLAATGSDTDIDLQLRSKGTGDIILADASGEQILIAADVATAVNEITITNAATGGAPAIASTGDDTNIDLTLKGKGTGKVRLLNEDSESLDVSKNAANEVLLQAGGAGSNIGLVLKGKGSGTLQLGDAEHVWPDTDASTADMALVSSGAGVLSWRNHNWQYLLINGTPGGTDPYELYASGLAALGTWEEFDITVDALSLNGTNNLLVQVGDDAGWISTNYVARSATIIDAASPTCNSSTIGFIVNMGVAAGALSGTMKLRRIRSAALPGGDSWAFSANMILTSTGAVVCSAGVVSLTSATPRKTIDRIRFNTSGSDTYDAGSVNLLGRL